VKFNYFKPGNKNVQGQKNRSGEPRAQASVSPFPFFPLQVTNGIKDDAITTKQTPVTFCQTTKQLPSLPFLPSFLPLLFSFSLRYIEPVKPRRSNKKQNLAGRYPKSHGAPMRVCHLSIFSDGLFVSVAPEIMESLERHWDSRGHAPPPQRSNAVRLRSVSRSRRRR